MGSGLVLTLLLGWRYGVSGYGQITTTIAAVSFVGLLVDWRLGDAVVKFGTDYQVSRRSGQALSLIVTAYAVSLVLGLLAWCAVLIGSQLLVGRVYDDPALAMLVRVYSLTMVAGAINDVSFGVMRTLNAFRRMSLLRVIDAVLRLALPAAFIRHDLSYIVGALVAQALISTLVSGFNALLIIRRQFAGTKMESIREDWGRISGFCCQTFVSACFKAGERHLDILLLRYFTDAAEVGLYGIARSVAGQLQGIYYPAHVAVYPTLAELAAKRDWQRFVKVLRTSTAYVLLVLTAFAFAALHVLPPLILIWKKQFYASLPAVPIMLTAFIIQGAAYWIGPASLSLGKPAIPMQANFIRVVVLVTGSFLLVRTYGYVYMAWTFLGMVAISTVWAVVRLALELRRERGRKEPESVLAEAT